MHYTEQNTRSNKQRNQHNYAKSQLSIQQLLRQISYKKKLFQKELGTYDEQTSNIQQSPKKTSSSQSQPFRYTQNPQRTNLSYSIGHMPPIKKQKKYNLHSIKLGSLSITPITQANDQTTITSKSQKKNLNILQQIEEQARQVRKKKNRNSFRVKTESKAQSKKSKIIRQKTEIDQNLMNALKKIPKKKNQRTQALLQNAVDVLVSTNPLFRKMNKILSTCFLKYFDIVEKQNNVELYGYNQQHSYFYIILDGVIQLKSPHRTVKYRKGAIIGDQLITSQTTQARTLDCATAKSQTFLLKISTERFLRMQSYFMQFGGKVEFNGLLGILKRSSAAKQIDRAHGNNFLIS